MLTVLFILAVGAIILTLIAATGKIQVWIPVLILGIIELLRHVPLGK